MKYIIYTITFLSSIVAKAQVAIGKNEITNSSVSLEFYDNADNTKGLVLPWTSTVVNQPMVYNSTTGAGYRGIQGTVVDGTIIFDLSDKKVKYMRNGSWSNLTGELPLIAGSTTYNTFDAIDTSLQDNSKELENAKVAIGISASTDTTTGILVLTDSNKAMILPKVVSPHLNILNPSPGMIVYDVTKKQLAVYNGTVWSFWKP